MTTLWLSLRSPLGSTILRSQRRAHLRWLSDGRPFDKVLIANRGEISSRVMRTCHELKIDTVALFSTFDSKAPFVAEATESICIGSSYLEVPNVIRAIQDSGAQAVHPGYGFLSENSGFATSVQESGVTWLGPSPEAIDQMGCKIRSKQLAMNAGVNVVPGFEGELQTLDHALAVANEIGYPVLLKAAAGGGGKGMRICKNDHDLKEGFPLARAEAQNFFKDSRLLVEKYVINPHHIEFQLLSGLNPDSGELDILVFCERECSIQRRHQKILEESPSPLLKEETRLAMVEQVKQLVRQVGYTSAGTVEFLVDEDQNFYFLEVNTRLQVEHPVTELVSRGCNLDLVKGMLWVGAGWGIPPEYLEQLGDNPYYPFEGHSIEARVYAEDPLRQFLPSTGPLIPYKEPNTFRKTDSILRLDTGVAEGHVVTPHYDPMLSKVIAWERQGRLAALDTLHTSLEEYVIGQNIRHNTRLVMDILRHPAFRKGDTPTSFLDTVYPNGFQGARLELSKKQDLAAIVVALVGSAEKEDVIVRLDGIFGEAYQVSKVAGTSFVVKSLDADGVEEHRERAVNFDEAPAYDPSELLSYVSIAGTGMTVQVLGEQVTGSIHVEMLGVGFDVVMQSPREYELSKFMQPPKEIDTSDFVLSPMPGTLVTYAVEAGDAVEMGQELCIIEAMKMQNIIRSPRSGTVSTLRVAVGASLKADDIILDFNQQAKEAA